MAVTAAELLIRVHADTKGAESQLRQLDATVGQAGKSAQQAGGGFLQFSQRANAVQASAQGAATGLGAFGKQAGTAGKSAGLLNTALGGVNTKALLAGAGLASAGVVAADLGKKAIGAAIDFESAFAGVAKTVDATDAELAVLEQGIRDMATEMPMAATELAAIAEAAGALGIETDSILQFTETVALIGTTTDVSSDQAATALGQLSNVLGLTEDDYSRFAAALVATGNAGASTESQILGITTRLGAAAELIGFTTDETIGWSSALANLGIEVEAAGSSAQKLFLGTAEHVAAAGDELELMAETAGMTADAFKQAFEQDSSAALQTFIAGLGELQQAEQLAVLEALGFSDIRITRAILGLAGNVDNLKNSLDVASTGWQENNAHTKEAEKRFDTTASKVQIFKNRVNELNLTLAEGYLPAMGLGLDVLLLWSDQVNIVADDVGELRDNILLLGGAVGGILPNIELAGGATGEWGAMLRESLTHVFPAVNAMGLLNNSIALYNHLTGESVEPTEEQAAALAEWVTTIEDAIPGTQSQAEAQRRHNDALEENKVRLREAGDATLETRDRIIEYNAAQVEMTQEGHRASQMAQDMGVHVNDLDRAMEDLNTNAIDPMTEALGGLSDAYGQALDVMGAFNSQSSEYEGIADTITAAYEAIQEKQESGIDLTDKEIMFLEDHEEALGRLEGGQRDATIEAGFAALAATELMEAQDALNDAIKNGETNLEPYKQRVAEAEEKLGIMGSTTGETQDAQTALKDTIQGPLIGAIQDLTREIEYVSKPWLIEIDAATEAAEGEIARLKEMIESGAVLPVSIGGPSGGGVGPGGGPYAKGTGPLGTMKDELAWVGEEGPELAWLPKGTHVLPNDESMRLAAILGGPIRGYAEGTGGHGAATPGSPPAGPHAGAIGIDWDAIAAAEAEEFVDKFGNAIDAAFSENPINFAENVQSEIDQLQQQIDLAPALGIPEEVVAGWEEELAGLQGEQDAFWAALAQRVAAGLVDPAVLESLDEAGLAQLEAYLAPIVGDEGAQKIIDGVGGVATIAIDQLRAALESGQGDVTQWVDDIILAVQDGRLPLEDAMSLLADIPQADLVPVLQQLTDQFGEDFVNAILAGDQAAADAADGGLALLQAILDSLGLSLETVNDEIEDVKTGLDTWSTHSSSVAPGGGGGGGGSSSGGGGGTGGGASSGSSAGVNPMHLPLDDEALGYLFGDTFYRSALDSARAQEFLASADERGIERFVYNPAGNGDSDKHYIDFDEAADLLLGTGRHRNYTAFAQGGITTGPQFALLGDNPSGQEAVIPLERAGEFAALMARELVAEIRGGPSTGDGVGDVYLDGAKVGSILGARVANEVRNRSGVAGIPVGIRR